MHVEFKRLDWNRNSPIAHNGQGLLEDLLAMPERPVLAPRASPDQPPHTPSLVKAKAMQMESMIARRPTKVDQVKFTQPACSL